MEGGGSLQEGISGEFLRGESFTTIGGTFPRSLYAAKLRS